MKGKSEAGPVPSMQNVAAYAGVSIATVSKVMQGDPTVRPENVVAVQNAIEALGYRINPLAAELRRGRRQLIGVVVASLDVITVALVRSLEEHAGAKGYAIWVECSDGSDERESMLIGRLQNWRVAGFILLRVHGRSQGPALLLENAAVVVIDDLEATAGFDSVSASPEAAARELSRQLRRTGHRSPLLLAPRKTTRRSEQLWAALVAALQDTEGLSMSSLRLDEDPQSAAAELGACLDSHDRPSAVIALEPSFDYLVASFAAARGWDIPSDLLLVGLRPAGAPEHWRAGGTALEYPAQSVAAGALDLLLRRLEQPRTPLTALGEPYALRE